MACEPIPDIDEWLEDVVFVGASQAPADTSAVCELTRYMETYVEPVDRGLTILQWWQKHGVRFPRCSLLAKKYLCIPASSVPAERVFSFTGNLVSKKRSRMNPENVDMLVFLNKNMQELKL